MGFYSPNSTRMILCELSKESNLWHGLRSRFAARWRHFHVTHSKPRFGNSPHGGPAPNRRIGPATFSRHKAVTGLSGFTKRAIDVTFAGLGLIVLSPLLAIIAVAVRVTDGGAVTY